MIVDADRLPRDARENPIQVPTVWVAGTLYQKSPITVSSVEKFLDVPDKAVVIVLTTSGAALRVSHGVGGTASTGSYDVIADGKSEQYPVASGGRLYMLRDASTDVTVLVKTWFVGA